LQCVAVCCSVLQCVAGVSVCCQRCFVRIMQYVAVCCSVLQCVAVCCSVYLYAIYTHTHIRMLMYVIYTCTHISHIHIFICTNTHIRTSNIYIHIFISTYSHINMQAHVYNTNKTYTQHIQMCI